MEVKEDIAKDRAQLECDKIIENRKINLLEKTEEIYTEVHHIIPKCLGGSDEYDNLVRLTSEEHYLAHWYLYHTFEDGTSDRYKLTHAFKMMNDYNGIDIRDRFYDAKLYQKCKDDLNKTVELLGLIRLQEVCEFINQKNRVPSINKSEEEKRLYSVHKRFKKLKKDGESWFKSYEKLIGDLQCYDYFIPINIEQKTLNKIQEICDFIKSNHYPSSRSGNKLERSHNSKIKSLRKNKVKNVNWYNSYDELLIKNNMRGIFFPEELDTAILQYSLDDELLAEYKNLQEASSKTSVPTSNISSCCNGSSLKAHGYVWKFKDETRRPKDSTNTKTQKYGYNVVNKYSINGEYINTYASAKLASEDSDVSYDTIASACNGKQKSADGFQWRYLKDVDGNIDIQPITQKQRPTKEVYQYDDNDVLLNTYRCIADAEKLTGFKHIGSCCRGYRNTSGGFKWSHDKL